MADNLFKAMTWDYPEEIPVGVGILPAVWRKHGDGLRKIVAKYPQFFGNLAETYDYSKSVGGTYKLGEHVDEWGCVWENIEDGMEAYVTGHPLKTTEDIRNLKIPPNRDGRLPHGFMYLRLLDLFGFENAMIEFAEESEEIQMLIDKVLEYNCYQIEAVIDRAGPVMYFGDDLGTQNSLAIGPEKWRKYLLPCYEKMYGICHDHGKLVYMHTDGMIWEIMPDLQKAGVNMVNPQFRANGLDNLIRVCKGKIPINLDLDRQMMPFCKPQDIYDHVRECVESLWLPQGGLGLNLEIGPDYPLENIDAAIHAVDVYRKYKGERLEF